MSRSRTAFGWMKLLALVCLLATAFTSTAEAWHFHAKDSADAAKTCPICVSAHQRTASATSSAQPQAPVIAVAEKIIAIEQPGVSSQETLAFFVRPPPLAV